MNWQPVTNHYYWHLERDNLGKAINWVNDRSEGNIKCSSLITTNTDDGSQIWSVPIIPGGNGNSKDLEVWNLEEDGYWHHVDNGGNNNHYFVDSIPEWDNVQSSWGFNKFSESPQYLEYLQNNQSGLRGGSVHSYKSTKRRSKKRKATKRKAIRRKSMKRRKTKRKVTRRKNTRRRRR